MSYETEANEIARNLIQKRLRKNPYVGDVVRLEVDLGVEYLTTKEAAIALNRTEQLLRVWACKGTGPIKPVQLSIRRLGWLPQDIENVLNGVAVGQ